MQQLTKKAVLHFNNGTLAWIGPFLCPAVSQHEKLVFFLLKSGEENLFEIEKIKQVDGICFLDEVSTSQWSFVMAYE